ncbi:hypothetical protein U6A24_06475 [Aquimarina gracilis]|uniref:Calx-beta domain-containing protein n=1 Tax=Aquimarina gracilis TaxID=874422 RepID=A0ABU5ZUN7_9FLAO|nr:hypothetical protein [Aquimarina gracilis]MEB3345097.1 hypothetical protein [Aquimarina gracilis]
MKRLIYNFLCVLPGVFLLGTSCANDDVNQVEEKEQFLVGVNGSEILFEDEEFLEIPLTIGFVTKEDSQVILEVSSIGNLEYGVDYTTIPDGSSGTITLDIPAGSTEATIQLFPIIVQDNITTPDRVINLSINQVSGGLILSSTSGIYQVTIKDQDFNLDAFAFTSFEEPRAGDINNYAAQDGVEQVNVVDADGNVLNSVDYVSTGEELGFDTSYVPGEEGGEDSGLFFGVTNVTNEPDEYNIGFFADGAQAYITSDADGIAEIVFDEIKIPSAYNVLKVKFSVYFVESSWESSDEFDIFWRTDDGDELIKSFRSNADELMTDQPDGTGNVLVDEWATFFADVTNVTDGRLVIQIGTNSGSEIAFIDDILIGGKITN